MKDMGISQQGNFVTSKRLEESADKYNNMHQDVYAVKEYYGYTKDHMANSLQSSLRMCKRWLMLNIQYTVMMIFGHKPRLF